VKKVLISRIEKREDGPSNGAAQIRKVLGLNSSASDADVLAAVRKLNDAIEHEKRLAGAERALAREAREAERKTVTNASMSYLKSAAIDYELQRRADLDRDIRKLQASDVGTATTKPLSTNIVDVNERTFAGTVKTALDQLREIAEQHRRAARHLSFSQAFSEVYQDPRHRDLVAREQAERFAGVVNLDPPEM
jgi:hypothetical protein